MSTPSVPDPSSCVVLVPVAAHMEPACEAALVDLATRGYAVRRVYGYAAIDQARNEMAAAALARVAIEASAVRVVLARLIERTNRQAP
jgi:hypothetical protein